MAKTEFISNERLCDTLEKEEELGRDLLEILGNREIDGRLYSMWKDKKTGTEYAVPEIRTVHMGFNSNEPGTVEKFVEIVEREGACKASWGVTGRTMHSILAERLKAMLPQFRFEIGYNYHCIARKE